MKSNRRKFLKQFGIRASVMTTGLPAFCLSTNRKEDVYDAAAWSAVGILSEKSMRLKKIHAALPKNKQ
jgi:hypothetical protein